MFRDLLRIIERPPLFSRQTIADLWTDPHISAQMLRYHLDPDVDAASRRGEFVARSAAWIAGAFGLGPGVRVLDLGCGPGLYTRAFARAGASVTGVEFSARSIEHARRTASAEGLEIEYVRADYLEWETDRRFDLVTLIYLDLCPLAPERRERLLRNVARWLAPGGAFLFHVASVAALRGREETRSFEWHPNGGFWSADPYFEFRNAFVYREGEAALDAYEIVEASRTRTIYNWLQHFTPDTLARELDLPDLVVEQVLGDVAGSAYDPAAPEFAVVARARAGA